MITRRNERRHSVPPEFAFESPESVPLEIPEFPFLDGPAAVLHQALVKARVVQRAKHGSKDFL